MTLRGDAAALRGLALIYLALDPFCAGESHSTHAQGPVLSSAAMRWFWAALLKNGAVPAAADLLQADLAGLPPALILAAECDPLYSEALAFHQRLQTAGNSGELLVAAGAVHGFVSIAPEGAQAKDLFSAISRFMQKTAHTPPKTCP